MASRVSHGGRRHDNSQRLLEVCGCIELAGGMSYDDVGLWRSVVSPSVVCKSPVLYRKSRNETVVSGGIGKKTSNVPAGMLYG